MLLRCYGASIKADSACREPALTWAARSGNIAAAQLLLDHGANVNKRNLDGFTPLQWAVMTDSPKLVQMLIDHGAKLQAADRVGWPVSTSNLPVIRYMLQAAEAKK